ncbi:MAG: undecaprenyl-diphosphate phosphatase [Candidatus Aenigmatarchaeota archaeon]
MVGLLEAALLGCLQGVTEWLPVSSSGHLALAQKMLGLRVPLAFDVALHAGTMLAVLAFFRKDILKMVSAAVRLDYRSEYGSMGLMVVLGTAPVALAGLLLHDAIGAIFESTLGIGVAMMLMGTVLWLTRFFDGSRGIGAWDALFVGAAQALALVPGISRSGITIAAGLSRRIDRRKAFLFSFMLSIPAVAGANVLEIYRAGSDLGAIGAEALVGVAAAAAVGYASIGLLRNVFQSNRMHLFAYYCWAVGAAAVAYSYLFA